MSETPTGPKVPGRPTTAQAKAESAEATQEAKDHAAEAGHEATDAVKETAHGFRARVRAIRNDYDVDTIERDAKPFLAGAVIVGATLVDPVLGATVAVNRIGRYVQRHHRKSAVAEAPTTTES